MKRLGDKYAFPDYPQVFEDYLPSTYFTSVNETLLSDVVSVSWKAPARLICVPKTYDKPRLIAAEPVVHQYHQQALMRHLRKGLHPLLRKVVDFNDQEPSRELALRASKTGEEATVDLSSASDRLSTWVVESFFDGNRSLLTHLLLTRSDEVYDPFYLQESRHVKKFAPMGSATTFPVQSIIYATAAFAAVSVERGWDRYPLRTLLAKLRTVTGHIQVFGDDIIVPKESLPYLGLILSFLQLKINSRKTHYKGPFREACGMDAYNGYKVTPVYISQTPPARPGKQAVAYVEMSNNAHRAGLWCLASAMLEAIPKSLRKDLPTSSEELGCLTLFTFCQGTSHHQTRWNKKLHRYEVYGLKPYGHGKKERRSTWTDLLQYFVEGPTEYTEADFERFVLRPGRQNVIGTALSAQVKLKPGWADARTDKPVPR